MRKNKKSWEDKNPYIDANETADGYNIRHIMECPGCFECTMILPEWYSGCEQCGMVGHISTFVYMEKLNGYLCSGCYEEKDKTSI